MGRFIAGTYLCESLMPRVVLQLSLLREHAGGRGHLWGLSVLSFRSCSTCTLARRGVYTHINHSHLHHAYYKEDVSFLQSSYNSIHADTFNSFSLTPTTLINPYSTVLHHTPGTPIHHTHTQSLGAHTLINPYSTLLHHTPSISPILG